MHLEKHPAGTYIIYIIIILIDNRSRFRGTGSDYGPRAIMLINEKTSVMLCVLLYNFIGLGIVLTITKNIL